MSRIGKNPIAIPAGVDVTIDGQNVTVKGPKGTLSHVVAEPITAKIDDGQVVVDASERRAHLAFAPRTVPHPDRQHDRWRDRGLQEGSRDHGYRLPRGRQGQGPRVLPGLLPHRSPSTPPEGIEFTIAPKSQTLFTVSGIDKQLVGETAARIRKLKKPEPYKGKGIHYVGETIRRKVGKAGK